MTIVKSQYRVANGTNFDNIYHFETDSEQVLMADGRSLEKVFNGESISNQNLSILKKDGKYAVTNCLGLPDGLTISETYLLNVFTVGETVWQTLYDHKGNNVYTRCMTNIGFSVWSNGGKSIQEGVTSLKNDVSVLNDTVKTHGEKIEQHTTKIENIVKEMGEDVTAHNHDERYMKISGGVFTGEVALNNNYSLMGNSSGGQSHSLIKMNSSNGVEVGNGSSKTTINSGGEIVIQDGTGTHNLVHSGNLEKYTDGLGGTKDTDVAKLNASNVFSGQQTIENSGLSLKTSATGLTFKDYSDNVIAKMNMSSTDLVFQVANTEVLRLRSSDKALITNNKFILQGNGEFRLAMKYSSSDDGVGFVASTSSTVRFTDWGTNRTIWEVNRTLNEVAFTNSIKIGGRKLTISTSAPSSPSYGDIWIN